MHDPNTVAFELSVPKPWGLAPWDRIQLITIWHLDPETDGSDDSCGWAFPKLTRDQIERLKSLAWGEARSPYFLAQRSRVWRGRRELAELMYRSLVLKVADYLDLPVTFEQAARQASVRIHGHFEDLDQARIFCFVPGYHSNCAEDRVQDREERFLDIVCGIARGLLADARPWYRQVRWHFWHWRIQIHPIQALKRWLWTRCATCGKGFRWGESGFTNQWDSDGPGWFRGERDLHHGACRGVAVREGG